jgi:hypothetical protein
MKNLAILLILCLTPMLYADESQILEPPPEIANDTTLMILVPAGEYTMTVPEPGILVFSPAGWKALSEWVYQEHVRSCESAIAEALKGQMNQVERLKRHRTILLTTSVVSGALAIVGGLIAIMR